MAKNPPADLMIGNLRFTADKTPERLSLHINMCGIRLFLSPDHLRQIGRWCAAVANHYDPPERFHWQTW